ncbi:venom carboxylesterase-6 isoform X1 [Nasonia vitripennis]|uniref:Carboxylic ester hydrolase n=2 Tax=Nasonia vitripennis TaxID=7425 RepID=A0A7M7PVX0_NASVI|nr:venom carboxylesterase-6 isoform X1 [Nasonia vitripennis]XP_031776710.1 venom carboxylesterase-6 isoform X1 [Nasonia vitripennis]
MFFYNLIITLITLPLIWSNDGPIVKTPLGWIKGYYDISSLRKKYEAFEGIPYAQPPIGNLRFEPPKKVLLWAGNWSATIASPSCMGFNIFGASNEKVVGVEDCLYLNLYRPSVRPEKLLSTIVWIHPGPLHFKPFEKYGPKFLMNRAVIYVELNFRLGPLGFLSTADEIISGNMGLKDQSMALKWLSENIKYFGGDPNKVTLTGGSGGASCVHYHMLSPMSAGLFQRAMSFSGAATNQVLQTTDPLKNAKILAKNVGCSIDNKLQMVACLKSVPAKSLFQALSKFTFWDGFLLYSPFSIVVEKTSNDAFLDQSPIAIIKKGKINDVPWLVTTTAGEGMFPAGVFFLNDTRMKSLNDNWKDLIFPLLKMEDLVPKIYYHEVAESIRKYYFGSKSISTDTKEIIEILCGDGITRYSIERSIRLMSKVMRNPIWFYRYSYRAAGTYCNLITNTNWTGPCHVDDTLLVVHIPEIFEDVTRPFDLAMQRDLLDVWVSMADYGIPKVLRMPWRPISPSDKFLRFLEIKNPGQYHTSFSTNFSNSDFWSSLSINSSFT